VRTDLVAPLSFGFHEMARLRDEESDGSASSVESASTTSRAQSCSQTRLAMPVSPSVGDDDVD